MKYIITILFSLMFISCKTQYQYIECGTYTYHYKETNDKEELILNNDNTFTFNSYKTYCSGRWKYIRQNTILISCNDVEFIEKIQSGYMNQRQREIKVLSRNRLKLPITNNVKMKYVILNKEE